MIEITQPAPDMVKSAPHYTALKIQPIEFIAANDLDFLQGNIVKYVCRYKMKNGVEDLKKARQYLDWLISKELGIPVTGEASK